MSRPGVQTHPETVAARRLLRGQHNAALATLSLKLEGHPFATGVDYITDPSGRPVFLISALAEHSKNLAADPRLSLLVQGAAGDVQASPRLTVAGEARQVGENEAEWLKQRYLRYFPEAGQLFALDFFFCRVEPSQLRYIGGFGAARWIAPGDFLVADKTWAEAEKALATQYPNLAGLDCDGFDLHTEGRLQRHEFPSTLGTPEQATKLLSTLIEHPPS